MAFIFETMKTPWEMNSKCPYSANTSPLWHRKWLSYANDFSGLESWNGCCILALSVNSFVREYANSKGSFLLFLLSLFPHLVLHVVWFRSQVVLAFEGLLVLYKLLSRIPPENGV